MSISREYYDEDGNYWQLETPEYIHPAEAVKHPEYVRGFISAEHFRKEKEARERFKRLNRNLEIAMVSLIVLLVIVFFIKRVME